MLAHLFPPPAGTWEAPTIPNPEYKGEWSPKMIDNPAYKVGGLAASMVQPASALN